MEIQFELNYDDFLDALTFHYARNAKRRRKMNRVARIVLVAEAGFVALVGMAYWLLSGRFFFRFASIRDLLGAAATSSITTLPWIELFTFLAICGLAQRKPRKAVPIVCVSMALVIASVIVVFLLAADHQRGVQVRQQMLQSIRPMPAWISSPTPFTLGNIFGWLTMLILCALAGFTFARLPKRLWKQQTNLRRPKTVEFRADGFRVADEFTNRNCLWSGIDKAVDTPSQLLLYYNQMSFEIIPKRAFADERMIDEFWRFAAEKGEANPHGFPVRAVIPI